MTMVFDRKKVYIYLVIFLVIISLLFYALSTFNLKGKTDEDKPQISQEELDEKDKIIQDFINNDKETENFFAEYRIERERVRGKQIELLREIINNQYTESKAREAASLKLVEISENLEKEMKAESLIKSKGFKECVVIANQENISVVIFANNLRLDQEKEIEEQLRNIGVFNEEKISLIVRQEV